MFSPFWYNRGMMNEFTITQHDTETLRIFVPSSDSTNAVIRDIPGITWDSKERHYTLHVTRRSVDALRDILRGRKYSIAPDALDMLKNGATMRKPYDVTLSPDKKVIIGKFEFHHKYERAFKSAYGKVVSRGEWKVNANNVELLLHNIESNELDLQVHPDVIALTETKEGLPGYSGYIAELNRLSIGEVPFVKTAPKPKRGKNLEQKLNSYGITTALDSLRTFPLRYIDRSNPILIRDLVVGESASVIAKISNITPYDRARRLTKVTIEDSQGGQISLAFFNQPWLSSQFYKGDEVVVYGKYTTTTAKSGAKYTGFSSPTINKLGDRNRAMPMVPVYPQSDKLKITTWDILKVQQNLARHLNPDMVDPMPQELLDRYQLIGRHQAYKDIHIPTDTESEKQARRRLVYEEFLMLQLKIQQRRTLVSETVGISHSWDEDTSLARKYEQSLPYTMTNAQQKATQDLDNDLRAPTPCHRLLQGDVGAGKSTIATWAMLRAVDSGYQGALMAPTEILAEQLFLGLKADIEHLNNTMGTNVTVAFLGSKTRVKEKRETLEKLASGELHLLVGTHSLISEDVIYKDLGIIVIDEQHRFGSEQRTALRMKRTDGRTPDVLTMTATPIPRTSSMVLYGDMDITILDELPPGRLPIKTQWIGIPSQEATADEDMGAWRDIKKQVEEGHQAYVVASLVEESETIAAASAEEAFHSLQHGALFGLRLGMVHGKQKRQEREETMNAFARGEIDVLVSTTVIEVGVNVPNATVMVILEAGRFGIAQLHQIRGRVGRSSIPSRCYLIGDTSSDEGTARLEALVESTDGFYLAEKDLEIRGEGKLFGTTQSGEGDLRIASLREHAVVLEYAQKDAQHILKDDPYLQKSLLLKQELEIYYPEEIKL